MQNELMNKSLNYLIKGIIVYLFLKLYQKQNYLTMIF